MWWVVLLRRANTFLLCSLHSQSPSEERNGRDKHRCVKLFLSHSRTSLCALCRLLLCCSRSRSERSLFMFSEQLFRHVLSMCLLLHLTTVSCYLISFPWLVKWSSLNDSCGYMSNHHLSTFSTLVHKILNRLLQEPCNNGNCICIYIQIYMYFKILAIFTANVCNSLCLKEQT